MSLKSKSQIRKYKDIIALTLFFLFGVIAQTSQASALSTQSIYVNPDGLIAYWDFAQCTGTSATDRSDWGLTGTLTGGVNATWVIGKYGCGVKLNGYNAYVDTNNNSILQFGIGSFTVSAWVYTTATNTDMRIVQKYDPNNTPPFWSLLIDNINNPEFNIRDSGSHDGSVIASSAITTSTWYYLTGVWDSSTHNSYIYINGVQKGTANNNNVANTNNIATVKIGRSDYGGGASYFNGTIDEPKIWNRALSAEEVYVDYLGTYQLIERYYANSTAMAQLNNTIISGFNNATTANSSLNNTLGNMNNNLNNLITASASNFANITDIYNLIGSYTLNLTVNNTNTTNNYNSTEIINNTYENNYYYNSSTNTTINYTYQFSLDHEQIRNISKGVVVYWAENPPTNTLTPENLYTTFALILVLLIISAGGTVYLVIKRYRKT